MIILESAVNWTAVWQMTGVGIGVVFCILVLLVFILSGFSTVVGGKKKAPQTKVKAVPAAAPAAQPQAAASDASDDEAAVATALFLFYQEMHDDESYRITIKHPAYSAWHAELN